MVSSVELRNAFRKKSNGLILNDRSVSNVRAEGSEQRGESVTTSEVFRRSSFNENFCRWITTSFCRFMTTSVELFGEVESLCIAGEPVLIESDSGEECFLLVSYFFWRITT